MEYLALIILIPVAHKKVTAGEKSDELFEVKYLYLIMRVVPSALLQGMLAVLVEIELIEFCVSLESS